MSCKIDALIDEAVPSLDEGSSVQQGAELMAERNLASVVVTRGGQVVGLFTERDLLRRVVAAGRDTRSVPIGDVCNRNLVGISHDSTCRAAVEKMQANLCRRLLVYRCERFVGIVHLTDVAHAMAKTARKTDLLVNVFGAVTLAVVIGVIALLLFQLPAMFQLAASVRGG